MADNSPHQSNVLIIRHLPSSLTASDKEDLLKHFGAASVKCMADKGRMKHTAFATFSDFNAAQKALHRLHQLEILGRTLTVEFARTRRQVAIATPSIDSNPVRCEREDGTGEQNKNNDQGSDSHSAEDVQRKNAAKNIALAANFGIAHPINPQLKYHYPHPTVSILSNIVNALASVPKFYVQTLHLMNKMNLPAPFGPLTPAPPLEDDERVNPPEPEEIPPPAEMEPSSSSEESEMESDEESRERARIHDQQLGHASVKRPREEKKASSLRKRPRLQDMIATAAAKSVSGTAAASGGGAAKSREAVFDPALDGKKKKAEIRLAESITSSLERHITHGQEFEAPRKETQAQETGPAGTEAGGFGTFQPARPSEEATKEQDEENEEEDEEDDDAPESSEFITRAELKKKLSKEEIKHISVFKNYNPGDPTTRLYIKNLAKQVEEKDLKFIYGRYVDWASPIDRDMFNIQLMKQGRMKGQAFVGLPSELAAQKALKDTNGFLLHDKPIVVSFARSAKPKEDDPKKKKSEAEKKKGEAGAGKRPRKARRI